LDRFFGIVLRIVPMEQIYPHEVPDKARLERLRQHLYAEQRLRDPLIVGTLPEVDGYILLDGTNRRAALHDLGYERLLVQVVDYADRHCVQLRTWSHVVDVPISDLLSQVGAIAGVVLTPVAQQQVDEALESAGALAAFSYNGQSWLASHHDHRHSRAELLRRIVNCYEEHMSRESRDEESIAEKLAELEQRGAGVDITLVTFPRFSRTQIASLALRSTPIPAGITRHILRCGRALRVNLPLDLLRSESCGGVSLEEAQARLLAHLAATTPRRYLEPTILFDS
jgi:hypothetical protein